MRKILKLFFIIFISILVFENVSAEKFVCEYEDVGLTMTWDTEKEFNVSSNPFVEMKGFDSSDDYSRFLLWKNGKKVVLTEQAEIDQQLYKEVLENYGCNDQMRVCIYSEVVSDNVVSGTISDAVQALVTWDAEQFDLGGFKQTLLIMTEDEFRDSNFAKYEDGGSWYILGHDKVEERWDNGYQFGDLTGSLLEYADGLFNITDEGHNYVYKETDCEFVKYNGPYIGVNINCTSLKNSFLEFNQQVSSYKNCSDSSCRMNYISKLKETENNINITCQSILDNYNYDGSEIECITECLNVKKTLNEYKKGTDLYDDFSSINSECGFSDKLVIWIANVVRWIKYIIPVAVMALGILDFIKAMAGDKDDEMKKAQGRFVKRLIAAALIFLAPIIIEFILDKMGFTANDCGIIDL